VWIETDELIGLKLAVKSHSTRSVWIETDLVNYVIGKMAVTLHEECVD